MRIPSIMSSDVLDTLKCPICLDYASDAVETNCCENIFCQKCLDELRDQKCPVCQKQGRSYVPSRCARRMVANIPVDCPNECGEKTARGELKRHLEICRKTSYTCPKQGCNYVGIKQEFAQHLATIHQQAVIEAAASFLGKREETVRYTCPWCQRQFEQAHEFGLSVHIVEEHGSNLVDVGNTISVLNRNDEPPKLKNCKGRFVSMAKNGKFYCGKEKAVFDKNPHNDKYGLNKTCGPTAGLNCAACMKLDASFRNLPYGALVNSAGSVCQAEQCNHKLEDRGEFYGKRRKTRPVFCRYSVCGAIPLYYCGKMFEDGSVYCTSVRSCWSCKEITVRTGLHSSTQPELCFGTYYRVWDDA